MQPLRNVIVLVALLGNLVTCLQGSDPICIYTEGGKICSSAESADVSQSEVAPAARSGVGQPAVDDGGSALSPAGGATSVNVTTTNTGMQENNTDNHVSNQSGTNTTSRESSVIAAQPSTSQEESSPVVDKPMSNQSSSANSEIQIPEHSVAKNQTSESATERLNRTEAVAAAQGQENTDHSETRAQTGDNALSPRKEASSDISPPELVAAAEGIVIASAVLQVATAKPPRAAAVDPAQEVALAEGVEMADAVLQAVKEEESAVNAIWRATLEAESRMKQDDTPVNEQNLDKGLMAFLVCVMIVLVITGSASGWVLYTRLKRTPEEDQAQNMYILIDAADPQSNFVDCPLDLNDSEGISYTFPRVTNDTLS